MKPLLSLMHIAVWALGCVVLAQAAPYIPEQDAVILQVQGHYPEALRSCLPLMKLADTLLATACMTGSASLSGQAGKSYELLLETLQSSQNASLEVRRWALTLLAEIAARRGDLK